MRCCVLGAGSWGTALGALLAGKGFPVTTWDRDAACCVPDTDCRDCRHYAAGSAVVTARLYRHATEPRAFRSWLDYVDTYLGVWVMGYEKGENLCAEIVPPPGEETGKG